MTDQHIPQIYQDPKTGKWGSTLGVFIYTSERDTREEVESQLRELGWDSWTVKENNA